MKKIAFVIPWYAADIGGGAETELRGIVEHLVKRGVELEVLTTQVQQFGSDWGLNYYPEGKEIINGVKVLRFPVRPRDAKIFDSINIQLMKGKVVGKRKQKVFMREFINSPKLYEYIETHTDEYSFFVYIPYMFSTNYYGILKCPEKSVMIPCFHDEAYIYMDIYKEAFENVCGYLFLSKEEQQLANRVFDISDIKQIVLGAGVETSIKGDGDRFREAFNIRDPYILYAGRKDVGKNIYCLLEYFEKYKEKDKTNLKLIMIGGGKVQIPDSIKNDVIDLGFVSEQEKYDAYAGAVVLCQPSVNESFSIVIMESWLAGAPVLVHEKCAVTKGFCDETNGGKYFSDYKSFEEAISFFLNNKSESEEMAHRGREYVLNNFAWNVIEDKLIDFFENLEVRERKVKESVLSKWIKRIGMKK